MCVCVLSREWKSKTFNTFDKYWTCAVLLQNFKWLKKKKGESTHRILFIENGKSFFSVWIQGEQQNKNRIELQRKWRKITIENAKERGLIIKAANANKNKPWIITTEGSETREKEKNPWKMSKWMDLLKFVMQIVWISQSMFLPFFFTSLSIPISTLLSLSLTQCRLKAFSNAFDDEFLKMPFELDSRQNVTPMSWKCN